MRIIEYQKLKWVDICKPKDEDIKYLADNFDFHPLILEEIKTPTYHPLLTAYKTYLFWILHFPNMDSGNHNMQSAEIDFLITKDAIITIRYQKFHDFEQIMQEIQDNPGSFMHKTTAHLFYFAIKKLFNATFPELDKIKEEIDQCENKIFRSLDDKIIERIAYIKHRVLDFIRAFKPQKSVWDASLAVVLGFWGEERLKPYFTDLVADYSRILYFAETHKEVIDSLHMTSSSLLDNKRNYVIKILTVFTAIILPLSLLTSIYGMNIIHLPFAGHPMVFWWLLGGMISTTVIMLFFFRRRDWI